MSGARIGQVHLKVADIERSVTLVTLDGAADHGVSEAIYLRDPDGNGVEIYCDRPASAWPRAADGTLSMVTLPLDMDQLLIELDG
jgi:catechol 2,3-dioxygenase